jgi:hypothetical protein
MGWFVCYSDWQWPWCVLGRRDTRRRSYVTLHGHLQLVVDWTAKIQERDPRPMGSCEARHPTALGLTSVWRSEWLSSSLEQLQEPFNGHGSVCLCPHEGPMSCVPMPNRYGLETTSNCNFPSARAHLIVLSSCLPSTDLLIRDSKSFVPTLSPPTK